MKSYSCLNVALLVAVIGVPAYAQERVPSHLRGNGSPRGESADVAARGHREMNTDRPDATESAHTVSVGHAQLEVGVAWSRNENGTVPVEGTTGPNIHFRYGISDDSEISIDFTPWESYESDGDTQDSMSDVTLAYKYNIWGNDYGETSTLAIAPYIVIPTGDEFSSDHIEGGIFIPLELTPAELQDVGLSFGFMLDAGVEWDGEDNDYEGYLQHTAVVGLDITDELGVFAEYQGIAYADNEYEAYANFGATYQINAQVALDLAFGTGLNEDSDDVRVWGGLSWRF